MVDDLNVFPVPDGDTGTNMSMTVMAAARQIEALDTNSVSKVAEIIALRDRYANETLRYQYQNDESMVEYITELIEKGDNQ